MLDFFFPNSCIAYKILSNSAFYICVDPRLGSIFSNREFEQGLKRICLNLN